MIYNLSRPRTSSQRLALVGAILLVTVIAFALDCFERGLLTEKQIGFKLGWGDSEAILKMVDLIAKRQGIGDLLAEGSRSAAEKIGAGAPELAVHVKGLELAMHESRGKKGLGISYATAPRGANHMEGFHDDAFASPDAFPELGIIEPMEKYTLEGKPKAALVPVGNRPPKFRQPVCLRIAMIGRIAGCFAETVDDMGWGGKIGITNGKADHILTMGVFLGNLPGYADEKVRRQFLDAFGGLHGLAPRLGFYTFLILAQYEPVA